MICGIEVAEWYCPVLDLITFPIPAWVVLVLIVLFGVYYYSRGLKDGKAEASEEKTK